MIGSQGACADRRNALITARRRSEGAISGRSHPRKNVWRVLVAVMLFLRPVPAWPGGAVQDIVVQVTQNGQDITVDVDCPVDAPVAIAWEVLTDYDHMAQFLSNVDFSGITDRSDNSLRVHQIGKAARGPLTFTFDNVRDVVLMPQREIHSHLISGDLKASNFVTRITVDAAGVHIVHLGHYTPNIWVPPLIGPALIRAETQKQFGEFRDEIQRRNALRPPLP